MIGYTSTPDFYRDYIEHGFVVSALKAYDMYKENTDKDYKAKKEKKRQDRRDKVKSAANKAHKYIYKYLNKKGKVIYVYDTGGKSRIRRMRSVANTK